ncbi:DUF6011 domain-containing protein [Dactylosporangium sp. NPDC050688]|uniref:DUF6011 domain-containing protein n=1 Tax=Dactylosporangium sp. NPDC050688 TaxID=3157217 RepID=UPI0033D2980E
MALTRLQRDLDRPANRQPNRSGIDFNTIQVGYYLYGADEIVWVKWNREGSRKYAQVLEVDLYKRTGRWVYAQGLISRIAGLAVLTAREAARLGQKYGCCVVCGRRLDDEKSITAGIGPVCASRLAG